MKRYTFHGDVDAEGREENHNRSRGTYANKDIWSMYLLPLSNEAHRRFWPRV